MFKKFLFLAFIVSSCASSAQERKDSRDLGRWMVENEDPDTRVVVHSDTIEAWTPKGLTIWYKQKIQAPCQIDYDAMVVSDGGQYDRLSDLNCFWMARDTLIDDGSVLARRSERRGVFVRQYVLQLYYLGFGGNGNKTTRFRRYDADEMAVSDPHCRPSIIKEYTDPDHLLRPNHWYHVHIECHSDGSTTYSIDGETLVSYSDPSPLLWGWFGFRTTKSHTLLANFAVSDGL